MYEPSSFLDARYSYTDEPVSGKRLQEPRTSDLLQILLIVWKGGLRDDLFARLLIQEKLL